MGGSRLDGAGSGLWALSIVLGRVIRWSLVQDGGRTFMGEGGGGFWRIWNHSKLSSNGLEGIGDHVSGMSCSSWSS